MQRALSELQELSLAPRINRALLQKQIELVTAHACAALEAAEKDLVAAGKDLVAAGKDAEIARLTTQALVADYLRIKGTFHARGLLEFAEQRLFAPLSPQSNLDRLSKWGQLGKRRPKLEASILAANPAWKAQWIPSKAVQVYSQLSASVHSVDLAANAVLIVEGPLSPEDMRFLKCVADAVHWPCDLRYLKVPSVITQVGQSADAAEGQPLAAAVSTEGQ